MDATNGTMRTAALVTGASSGIGLALARLFATDGHHLVLVARSEHKLRAIGAELEQRNDIVVAVVPADLAAPHAARSIVDALEREQIEIDVLVNNAGYGSNGTFLANDLHNQLGMIQVHVAAMTELAHLMLPGMVQRGSGRILNVASTAAFSPGPLNAVYHATKAHVLSFSEALAEELDGSGVTVTALCPGPTATGFSAAAGVESSRLFSGGHAMSADQVARAGYQGLNTGKRVVVPGLRNKVLAQSVRLVPRRMLTKIARRLWEDARPRMGHRTRA